MQRLNPCFRRLVIATAIASCLGALGCRDRASEEDCRAACRNSVELSFWSDFEDEYELRKLRPRARQRKRQEGARRLERALEPEGELYETLEGCVTVCRRSPTPPEIVACQIEADSVSQLNSCVAKRR